MTGIVRIFMLTSALLALALSFVAASAWRQRRRLSALVGVLAAALCLSVGALCATISVGIRGYRTLTAEVVAATIVTEPLSRQRFRATVTLPDRSVHMFDLAGDAIYVDAHILKWRPLANLVGLHTAYDLARRYWVLRPFVDAQYGSATFINATAAGSPRDARQVTYEVRVSTTGLLVRAAQPR